MKLDSQSDTRHAGKDSNLVKDLNLNPKTIKLLEKSKGHKLLDGGLGDGLLDMIPEAKTGKVKMNKWNYIRLPASAQQRRPSTKWKGSL